MKKLFVQPIWKLCAAFCLTFLISQTVLLNAQTPCKNNGLACPELKRQRNGSGSLGNSYSQVKCGLGYTAASVRLGQRFNPPGSSQPASFVISGIPLGAFIEKAFLWSGTSGNGVPVTATVQNPVPSSSSFPMTLIGSGADKCWGYAGSHSYRADVTSIISGNGTYLISGLPTGTPNETDGATLFIIYSDPSSTYTGTISISDGSIVVNGGGANSSVSYPPPSSNATFAAAFCVMSDIQLAYTSFDHSGVNVPYNSVNMWWSYTQSAPSIIAGQSTSSFSWNSNGDCVNWVMAGVYFRTPNCNKFCCPGENLVINGDFEASGNPGVNTLDYIFNSNVATGATLPGQYNIVTGAEALTINRCWVAQDPSTCSNTSGKFLAVNGRTCGGKKIVWQQSFTVNDWTCYEFCASVKNLKKDSCSCDFDVQPNIEVEFSMAGIGNITQLVNVSPGACNWIDIKKQICLWGYGSSLTIKILLDESVPGDGNDLALDNIALIAIPRCPKPLFTIATKTFGTYYEITATSSTTANCNAIWWEVCEYTGLPGTGSCINASTVVNPTPFTPGWYLATTNFPTYNGFGPLYTPQYTPGRFQYGKLYRISRGTWGDCDGWEAFQVYVATSRTTKKVKTFTEEEFKRNPKAVLKALK